MKVLGASPSRACPGIQPHGYSAQHEAASRLSSTLGMHRDPAQQPDRLLSVFFQELSSPPPPQCPAAYGLLKRGRPRPLGTSLRCTDYDLSQVSRVRSVGRRARHCARPHAPSAPKPPSWNSPLSIPSGSHSSRGAPCGLGNAPSGRRPAPEAVCSVARSWRPSPLDTPSLIRGIRLFCESLWLPRPCGPDGWIPVSLLQLGEEGRAGSGGGGFLVLQLDSSTRSTAGACCRRLRPPLPLPYSTRSGSGPRQQPLCSPPFLRVVKIRFV